MTVEPTPWEITTERLRLRPWRVTDAEAHRSLWTERDPRTRRRIDAEGRPTVEDLRDWIAEQPTTRPESGLGLLAVERRIGGDFIGYCGLIVGQASIEEPEIAYELARRFHGHGYATEAARAVVATARASGKVRLWATVREWNAASFRVLEKLDFTRSDKVTPDPERGDSLWMTRLV